MRGKWQHTDTGGNRCGRSYGTDTDVMDSPIHARGEVRGQLMIFKTFIAGMVLVGITVILTELHRYMVYSEELEREEENAR